jgi:uncharacterized protein YunC (DUF1805 family)
MLIEKIELNNGTAIGLSYQLQKAPLIVVNAERGFVMCGYLDMQTAAALGDAAVKVKGIKNFEELLKAPVVDATPSAISLGVKTGMTGKEALELMF